MPRSKPRDFLDKISRLALAIERAGGDHLGDTNSLHQDLISIIDLVPEHMRDRITIARLAGAADGGPDDAEETEENDL